MIFSGEVFDSHKKELRDIKYKAHAAFQRYNVMDAYYPDRLPIIKELIGGIGKKYYFQGPIQFNYGSHTFIGACSVVTKDIPDNCLEFSNPCRPGRPITEAGSKKHLILEEDLKHLDITLNN